MSEFSSMLASFKSAASSARTSSASTPKTNPPSSSTSSRMSPSSSPPSRKRQHQRRNPAARPIPSFPSMHAYVRKEGDFELSFLVIGAQKAGTSWLHSMLRRCPSVALPRDTKEVHFWDWHHGRGFDWYVRQFGFPRRSSGDGRQLYGEITPCYAVLPPPTIAEIGRCFPDVKLIFVARDLVDRAWSAMIMELRDQTMGLNPGEFATGSIPGNASKRAKKSEGVMSVAQQRRMQQQSSPSAQPDSYYLERMRSDTHASRSDYATHLKHWYAHFPSDNILIVDYREIEKNPRDVLLKVAMHIGLTEDDAKAYVEQLSDEDVRQRVNAATNTKPDKLGGDSSGKKTTTTTSEHTLSQRPRLRKMMEEYLRPHATKFNVLLKEEGYTWKLNDYTG